MKSYMEGDTDLDSTMVSSVRCAMHLEIMVCVVGGEK